jgi:hypothetical protein
VHPVAPVHGLGKLADDTFAKLKQSVNFVLHQVTLYQAITPSDKQPPIFQPLVKMLKHGLAWLQSVYTTFRQMEFSLQDMQWTWLELTAILDYMQTYKPHMDAHAPSTS